MKRDEFLGAFMSNPARAKLLRVMLLNQSEPMTAGMAGKRAGVKPDVALREMKKLATWGILKRGRMVTIRIANGKSKASGKTKVDTWAVNQNFRHLRALSIFVHDVAPVRYDSIVGALKKSGRVSAVVLSGCFLGDDTRPADLLVAVDSLNERRVDSAIRAIEPSVGREIRYAAFSTPEFRYRMTVQDKLIRDTLDFPHVVLFDKTRLL
jgi:hypothetical protein